MSPPTHDNMRHCHKAHISTRFIKQTYPSISRIATNKLSFLDSSQVHNIHYYKEIRTYLISECFILEPNHWREGRRGEAEMKRLHNNHQKIIARDRPRVWRWDSVLHLTPGIPARWSSNQNTIQSPEWGGLAHSSMFTHHLLSQPHGNWWLNVPVDICFVIYPLKAVGFLNFDISTESIYTLHSEKAPTSAFSL